MIAVASTGHIARKKADGISIDQTGGQRLRQKIPYDVRSVEKPLWEHYRGRYLLCCSLVIHLLDPNRSTEFELLTSCFGGIMREKSVVHCTGRHAQAAGFVAH